MFADSTFYSDPDGKFPTLEEQVNLAQTVANSILLPVNRNSQGHRMFMRMRQRARAWTIGATQDEITSALAELDLSQTETVKFYQENPWAARLRQENQSFDGATNSDMDCLLPSASGIQSSVLFVPNLRANMTEEQLDALSPDEYERVLVMKEMEKLREKQHPAKSVCFLFTDDIRQMKGKGAKLFAARQAKAAGWAIEDDPHSAKNMDEAPSPSADQVATETADIKTQTGAVSGVDSSSMVDGGPSSSSSSEDLGELYAERFTDLLLSLEHRHDDDDDDESQHLTSTDVTKRRRHDETVTSLPSKESTMFKIASLTSSSSEGPSTSTEIPPQKHAQSNETVI